MLNRNTTGFAAGPRGVRLRHHSQSWRSQAEKFETRCTVLNSILEPRRSVNDCQTSTGRRIVRAAM